jgi:hypothetical protein
MFTKGAGPMWWGIGVVLAFTAAISIRFFDDVRSAKAGPPPQVVTR